MGYSKLDFLFDGIFFMGFVGVIAIFLPLDMSHFLEARINDTKSFLLIFGYCWALLFLGSFSHEVGHLIAHKYYGCNDIMMCLTIDGGYCLALYWDDDDDVDYLREGKVKFASGSIFSLMFLIPLLFLVPSIMGGIAVVYMAIYGMWEIRQFENTGIGTDIDLLREISQSKIVYYYEMGEESEEYLHDIHYLLNAT